MKCKRIIERLFPPRLPGLHGGRLLSFQERFIALLDTAQGPRLPIEPLAYTLAECDPMFDPFHVGICDALAFGYPLTGAAAWAHMRPRFDGLLTRGLVRGKHAWILPPDA